MAEISTIAIMQAELFIGIMSANGIALLVLYKYFRWKERNQKAKHNYKVY